MRLCFRGSECVLRAFLQACAVESNSGGSLPLHKLFAESAFSLPVNFSTTVTRETILAIVRAFVRVFLRACTSEQLRLWQFSTAQTGFGLSSFPYQRQCGTIPALSTSQRQR